MTNYKINRGVAIPKAKLRANPWNPNHMKDRQQEAVKESIAAYGQVMELLVRPHPSEPDAFQIIDGEHRFNVLPDTVYCNVIHGLSDADAKKLTIVMNETRGSADKIELSQLLSELNQNLGLEQLMVGLPYLEKELKELVSLADVDWDQFEQDFDQSSVDAITESLEAEPPPDNDDTGGEDGKGTFITITLSLRAIDLLGQAESLISDEQELPENRSERQGVVIERLAESYLAVGETKT